MSRVSIAIGGLLMAALLAHTIGPASVAQERRDDASGFDGQFVSIVKKSNPSSSTDLEKVQIRKVDGRAFVVGVGADVPDNWQKGRTVWVALDDVSEVTVFSTLEELRKAGIPSEK
jgi:hypothetical protein